MTAFQKFCWATVPLGLAVIAYYLMKGEPGPAVMAAALTLRNYTLGLTERGG